MPPPAIRVKATTLRRDSREVAKLCLRLIAETDARSVGDSHPSCCRTYNNDSNIFAVETPFPLLSITVRDPTRISPWIDSVSSLHCRSY